MRTTQPVAAGANATTSMPTPISSASGSRHRAAGTTPPSTVSSPVIQGMRRAEDGVPYRTAEYTRSVYSTIVTTLPRVTVSRVSASVPTARPMRGRERRSGSHAAVTASGTNGAQGAAHCTSGSEGTRGWIPNSHSSTPPSSPLTAIRTSSRWGGGAEGACP
ncbi:hypothetical protein ACWDZ8_27160 [Streptomyces sp. NPDC003233]